MNKTYKLYYCRGRKVYRLELPERLVRALLHTCEGNSVVARIVDILDTGEVILRFECGY